MAHDQETREQIDVERERVGASEAASSAQRMAQQSVEEMLHNPEFLERVADPDMDTDVYDWVEDELGPVTSRAHILGYRSEDFERESKWLNMNKAERAITERNPGRLLRQNEDMLRIAQDAEQSHSRYRQPATSDQRRAFRDAYEVVTQRQTLSIEGKGIESQTKATAEHRTVTNQQEDSSTTRKTLRELMG